MTTTEAYGKLVGLCLTQTQDLNRLLFELQDKVDEAHFSHLKLMVGIIMGNGFMPVLEEVGQKFPELRQDWDHRP